MLRVDATLLARLDRSLGASSARYARACAARAPGCGARVFEPRAGVFVVDSGAGGGENAGSAFGLGHDGPVTADDLDAIERFYAARPGAAPRIVASPVAHESLHALLAARGYGVARFSSLLVRDVAREDTSDNARDTNDPSGDGRVVVRALAAGDVDELLDIEEACYGPGDREVARARALPFFEAPATVFGASLDAPAASLASPRAAACGALVVEREDSGGGGWLFAGMCKPAMRARGLQAALIHARVAHARALGLDVVASLAAPASTSERNLRCAGFALASTHALWTRSA